MRDPQNQAKTAKQKQWIRMEIDADLALNAAIENYRDYVDAMLRYCRTHGQPPGYNHT
jgi:hypothetical protein